MTDDPTSKVADDILALINSKPRSPLKSEIEDIIRLHMPYRPAGYLVNQEQLVNGLNTISFAGSGGWLQPVNHSHQHVWSSQ